MNIIQLLQQHSKRQPERTALIHGQQLLSYAELESSSQQLAHLLQQRGLRAGQRVLLFVPVSLPLYQLFLAIVRLGAVVVFIDPALGKEKLNAAIATLKPDYFLGSTKAQALRLLPSLSALRQIPCKLWSMPLLAKARQLAKTPPLTTQSANPAQAANPEFNTPPSHPALITFTSGSTGTPKAILRSHGFLIEQNRTIQSSLRGGPQAAPQATELNTLPVFVLSSLASGLSVLLAEHKSQLSRRSLSQFCQQISSHRVSQILTSPDFLDQLCRHLAQQISKDQSLPQVQQIFTGGAPIFANLLEKLRRHFPQAQLTTVYGSTEAEPIAHHQLPRQQTNSHNSPEGLLGLLAGKPIDAIRLAILPDRDGQPFGTISTAEFQAQVLPSGQAGEIVVTGAHVQKHYLHGDESKTKFQVSDGEAKTETWHRTGDAGYLDAQGQLWLLGRCSAKVEHQGQTLYPFALEAQAMRRAEVQQAALVQLENQLVLALSSNSPEPENLKIALQAELPQLQRIEILKQLPTDPRHHSKILYSKLKQELKKKLNLSSPKPRSAQQSS